MAWGQDMATNKKAKKKAAKKKKIAAKKTIAKKKAKKKSTKKKIASRSRPAKKQPVKKKAKKKVVKKNIVKKKVAKKKVAKKKVNKKVAKKKVAKKKVNKKVAKKKVAKKKVNKKVAKKKVAKKKTLESKSSTPEVVKRRPGRPGRPPKVKVVEKKPLVTSKGKENLLSLKSKTFRRSTPELQTFKPYHPSQGEEFMNADQTEHFRHILLDWKKLLMEEVDRTVHHMQDEAANFPDPNDRATQEEEFALELRTRDRERKLIRKIDEAVLRLETGDFGFCEICGVDIGIKRLEARPTATLCIDCKTLDEIKEKQLG